MGSRRAQWVTLPRTSTGSPQAHSGTQSSISPCPQHSGTSRQGYSSWEDTNGMQVPSRHVILLGAPLGARHRVPPSWAGGQGPSFSNLLCICGLFRAWSNRHPQRRVLPNTGEAGGCFCYRSGLEGLITAMMLQHD